MRRRPLVARNSFAADLANMLALRPLHRRPTVVVDPVPIRRGPAHGRPIRQPNAYSPTHTIDQDGES